MTQKKDGEFEDILNKWHQESKAASSLLNDINSNKTERNGRASPTKKTSDKGRGKSKEVHHTNDVENTTDIIIKTERKTSVDQEADKLEELLEKLPTYNNAATTSYNATSIGKHVSKPKKPKKQLLSDVTESQSKKLEMKRIEALAKENSKKHLGLLKIKLKMKQPSSPKRNSTEKKSQESDVLENVSLEDQISKSLQQVVKVREKKVKEPNASQNSSKLKEKRNKENGPTEKKSRKPHVKIVESQQLLELRRKKLDDTLEAVINVAYTNSESVDVENQHSLSSLKSVGDKNLKNDVGEFKKPKSIYSNTKIAAPIMKRRGSISVKDVRETVKRKRLRKNESSKDNRTETAKIPVESLGEVKKSKQGENSTQYAQHGAEKPKPAMKVGKRRPSISVQKVRESVKPKKQRMGESGRVRTFKSTEQKIPYLLLEKQPSQVLRFESVTKLPMKITKKRKSVSDEEIIESLQPKHVKKDESRELKKTKDFESINNEERIERIFEQTEISENLTDLSSGGKSQLGSNAEVSKSPMEISKLKNKRNPISAKVVKEKVKRKYVKRKDTTGRSVIGKHPTKPNLQELQNLCSQKVLTVRMENFLLDKDILAKYNINAKLMSKICETKENKTYISPQLSKLVFRVPKLNKTILNTSTDPTSYSMLNGTLHSVDSKISSNSLHLSPKISCRTRSASNSSSGTKFCENEIDSLGSKMSSNSSHLKPKSSSQTRSVSNTSSNTHWRENNLDSVPLSPKITDSTHGAPRNFLDGTKRSKKNRNSSHLTPKRSSRTRSASNASSNTQCRENNIDSLPLSQKITSLTHGAPRNFLDGTKRSETNLNFSHLTPKSSSRSRSASNASSNTQCRENNIDSLPLSPKITSLTHGAPRNFLDGTKLGETNLNPSRLTPKSNSDNASSNLLETQLSGSKSSVPKITVSCGSNNIKRVVQMANPSSSNHEKPTRPQSETPSFNESSLSNDFEMNESPDASYDETDYDTYLKWYFDWRLNSYKPKFWEKIKLTAHDLLFKNAALSTEIEASISTDAAKLNFKKPILPPAKRPPGRLLTSNSTVSLSPSESTTNTIKTTSRGTVASDEVNRQKPTKEKEIDDDAISLFTASIMSDCSGNVKRQTPLLAHLEKRISEDETGETEFDNLDDKSVDSAEHVKTWITNTDFNKELPKKTYHVREYLKFFNTHKPPILHSFCYFYYFTVCKYPKEDCSHRHRVPYYIKNDIQNLEFNELVEAYDYAKSSTQMYWELYQDFIEAFVNFNSSQHLVEIAVDCVRNSTLTKLPVIKMCINGLMTCNKQNFELVVNKLMATNEYGINLADLLLEVICSKSAIEICNQWLVVRKLIANRACELIDYGIVNDIMRKASFENNPLLAQNILHDILIPKLVCFSLIEVDLHVEFSEFLHNNDIEGRNTYFKNIKDIIPMTLKNLGFNNDRLSCENDDQSIEKFQSNKTLSIERNSNVASLHSNNMGTSEQSFGENVESHLNNTPSERSESYNLNKSSKRFKRNTSNKSIRSAATYKRCSQNDKNLIIPHNTSPENNSVNIDKENANWSSSSSFQIFPDVVNAQTDPTVESELCDEYKLDCDNTSFQNWTRLKVEEIQELSKIINEGNGLSFLIRLCNFKDTSVSRSFVIHSICFLKEKQPADALKLILDVNNSLDLLANHVKGGFESVFRMFIANMVIVFEQNKAYNEAARLILLFLHKLEELIDVEWLKKINDHILSQVGKFVYFCKILLRGGNLKSAVELFMRPELKLTSPKEEWTFANDGNYDVDFRNDILQETIKAALSTDVPLAQTLIFSLITAKSYIDIDLWKYFNVLILKLVELIRHENKLEYRDLLKTMMINILNGAYKNLKALTMRGLLITLVKYIPESQLLQLYSKCCTKNIYSQIKAEDKTINIRTDMADEEIYATLRYYFDKLLKKKLEAQDVSIKIIVSNAEEIQIHVLVSSNSMVEFKKRIYRILLCCFPFSIFVKETGVESLIVVKAQQLKNCIDYYYHNPRF